MMTMESVRRLVESALAYAHAALDDTTPMRVAAAKMYAGEVLPYLDQVKPRAVPLGEARQLLDLVGQLRAVLGVLEKKTQLLARERAN